jgi:hypothetical protein
MTFAAVRTRAQIPSEATVDTASCIPSRLVAMWYSVWRIYLSMLFVILSKGRKWDAGHAG